MKLLSFVKNNIEIILIGLIPATLIFKENINSLFIILYVCYWLKERHYKAFNKSYLKAVKYYLFLIVLYLLFVFYGNFRESFSSDSTNFLVKQLAILLFPIILIHIKWTLKKIELFNKLFVLSSLLFILFLYGSFIVDFFETKSLYVVDPNHPTWKYYKFTSGRLSPEVHPTYLSVYLVFNIVFLFSSLKKTLQLKTKLIYSSILGLFLVTLILLSSRAVLFSFFSVYFFYQIYEMVVKRNKNSILSLLVLSSITLFIFFGSSPIFNRVSKLKNSFDKGIFEIANFNNSLGERTQVYLIASEVIRERFWIGIGTKNWEVINKEFYEKHFKNEFDYKISELNTHNQYLNALISWGIFGLIVFTGILCFHLYFSFKLTNKYLFVFWIFLSIVLFTENMLDRHRGVIFFSVLSAYTISVYLSYREENKTTIGSRVLQ